MSVSAFAIIDTNHYDNIQPGVTANIENSLQNSAADRKT